MSGGELTETDPTHGSIAVRETVQKVPNESCKKVQSSVPAPTYAI